MSSIDDLHKLAELRDRGVISEKEFEKQKVKILRGRSDQSSSKGKSFGLGWKTVIGIIAVVVVIAKFSQVETDRQGVSTTTSSPVILTAPVPAESQSADDLIVKGRPRDEAALVAAVASARQQYASGPNEMAKGAARPARAKALCAAVPSKTATGWIGKVASLSTNGDGKGVLNVKIGPDTYVQTVNNSFSDILNKSLIEPSSPLFQIATALHEGQLIKFSGKFFPSQADCLQELSMSLSGSIQEPEFTFAFSSISPLN